MTNEEKEAFDSLTQSFTKMETLYKIKRNELEIKENEIKRLEAENAALRERLDKAIEIPFKVIDKLTGDEADIYNIALNEKWASHLVYCDMEGFAVEQDGSLVLLDECDHMAYPSADRFEIISEKRLAELKGQK